MAVRERGARGSALPSRRAAAAAADRAPAKVAPYRGGRSARREVLDVEPEGYLLGDWQVAYYDRLGRFVRVLAGGRQVVERYGPLGFQKRLSAEDAERLRRARKRARDLYWKARKAPGDG